MLPGYEKQWMPHRVVIPRWDGDWFVYYIYKIIGYVVFYLCI